MEITSILGPVLGIVAVCGTAMIKGLPVSALVGGSAAMIVGLGTLSAVLGAYPLKDVIFSFKSLGVFFNGPKLHTDLAIADIERLAQLARKDGVLALEKEIEKLDDAFMKKGIEMVSMNVDPPVIEESLYNEISMMYEEEEVAAKFWEDMGAFSPTVGIIGAVLGLMVVMLNLNNPDEIGPGIKAAFIATIYGVGIANLFALPCGKKIKRMCHHKKIYREIVATGIIGIAMGTSPKDLVERLKGMAGGH
ncbi:MAG: MotA/TolQ/ExbB proton channel family protein [Silvanigrellaceae bacterium]|nr:MotA/TolQ/ExbB proton channel family protein [Silvanigrellaceae bacterium]